MGGHLMSDKSLFAEGPQLGIEALGGSRVLGHHAYRSASRYPLTDASSDVALKG